MPKEGDLLNTQPRCWQGASAWCNITMPCCIHIALFCETFWELQAQHLVADPAPQGVRGVDGVQRAVPKAADLRTAIQHP